MGAKAADSFFYLLEGVPVVGLWGVSHLFGEGRQDGTGRDVVYLGL